jgi:hypothetical protein
MPSSHIRIKANTYGMHSSLDQQGTCMIPRLDTPALHCHWACDDVATCDFNRDPMTLTVTLRRVPSLRRHATAFLSQDAAVRHNVFG